MNVYETMIYEFFTIWVPWTIIAAIFALFLWLTYLMYITDSIRK